MTILTNYFSDVLSFQTVLNLSVNKDGQTMKFISFEDQTGIYETVLFPKIYHRYCHMLNATRPYILKGKVEENFGAITMTVNWIGFLDRYNQRIKISRRSKRSYSE